MKAEKLKVKNLKKVVVRGTNWVGDAVMTVPALRELRHLLPDAHITLATRAWAEGLFAEVDFVDELLMIHDNKFRSLLGQAHQWRAQKFDLAVVLPNSFQAALIPALAGVPHRIGYATEGRGLLLTESLPLPEWRNSRHEVYYYLNVIKQLGHRLGAEVSEHEPDSSLKISAARESEARQFLRTRGVADKRTIVALCPGSINSRAKRWPAERFAAVADRLTDELGAEIVLIGSTDEIDVSDEVKRLMQNQPKVLTGETNLAQIVAILSQVDLLITNDTGPAHIASALGRPTIVIFGPTNPLTTKPFSDAAEILREPPDCAPCTYRDCPIDHRCMTAITVEQVFQRAKAWLGQSASFSSVSKPSAMAG
jgi:lipopolysaccharide heptosyltransferase II